MAGTIQRKTALAKILKNNSISNTLWKRLQFFQIKRILLTSFWMNTDVGNICNLIPEKSMSTKIDFH